MYLFVHLAKSTKLLLLRRRLRMSREVDDNPRLLYNGASRGRLKMTDFNLTSCNLELTDFM